MWTHTQSPVLLEIDSVGQHWMQEGRQGFPPIQQIYRNSSAQVNEKEGLLTVDQKAPADSEMPNNTLGLTK